MNSVDLKQNLNKANYETLYETAKGNRNIKPLFHLQILQIINGYIY